jgi:hypothetical protein
MTIETPFGTTASDETPFDGDTCCVYCGDLSVDDLCDDCFEARWTLIPVPTIPTTLAA